MDRNAECGWYVSMGWPSTVCALPDVVRVVEGFRVAHKKGRHETRIS